jgi:hypothetical protein
MQRLARFALVLAGAAVLAASLQGQSPSNLSMNALAERYVKLVLAMGPHDAAYVDAFYGPPEWKAAADRDKRPLPAIATDAETLIRELDATPAPADALDRLRREYLRKQLQALRTRTQMLGGTRLSFDEESAALYDAVAPTHPDAYFQTTLDELDKRLPGTGPLVERLERFRQSFVVPKDKLPAVFAAAIAECRRRTLAHVALPASESFTVEYVTNKSWSGYNWYQGNYRSLIQVNTDLPIFIDRAVDLACHEGYPGHHVYNVLLEQRLVRERGWIEMTVYPLFSPQSLIAEGSANYGIEMAFPRDERVDFERRVLFPAAGLDPSRAAEYYSVFALTDRLSYAQNEAARHYLDGRIDRAAAAAWLSRYSLSAPARSEQRVRFMDDYRSYVINYNLGKDLVRDYVERQPGAADAAQRWRAFVDLLSSPRLPSGLR